MPSHIATQFFMTYVGFLICEQRDGVDCKDPVRASLFPGGTGGTDSSTGGDDDGSAGGGGNGSASGGGGSGESGDGDESKGGDGSHGDGDGDVDVDGDGDGDIGREGTPTTPCASCGCLCEFVHIVLEFVLLYIRTPCHAR